MATDLVFTGSPLTTQPIGLVFNESDAPNLDRQIIGAGRLPGLRGSSSAVNAVVVEGSGKLPALRGRGYIGSGFRIVGAGRLPALRGTGRMVYNSDTQRPMVATVRDNFQDGIDARAESVQRYQEAKRLRVEQKASYQEALPFQIELEQGWKDAERLRTLLADQYQQGLKVRNGVEDAYQQALSRRTVVSDSYQQGLKVRSSAEDRFFDTLKRRNWTTGRYQQASKYWAGWITQRVQKGRPIEVGVDQRYQDAIRPRPGLWFRPPVEPTDPCYVPSPNLVFTAAWSADTNLVFICERHSTGPGPGDTVVVPVKRIYVVLNSSLLRRVEGNIALPTFGMSLSLDVDSWTWSFSASLPGRALADIEPDEDGTGVEVEALINGVAYRFLIEKIGRERAFAVDGLRVSGRGLMALLDAPYAPVLNFGNATSRTAQQLMGDVLTLNGVPLDWAVDWQIEDWVVPGGIWAKQGTYIDALNEIVAAAGGYLQPTPTGQNIKALLRYPTLPWAWGDVTPDFELPSDVITRESTDWVDKPRYNRVFVSGVQGGVLGQVTRAGTAGDLVGPMVTDTLATDAVAARQRGGSILADTGRIATYGLRMPVLAETGVIPPGKFIRYVDGGVERLGITRSVSVEVSMPAIWQTIAVETHESV